MINFKQHLTESSLSRIYRKTKEFDAGAITSYRDDRPKRENKANNRKLLAYLLDKNYSVTKVKGSYIENFGSENQKEVGEESFFVVDHEKTGNLKQDLIKLGKLFDQDSILFVEKGKEGALYGTSKRNDAFPAYGQKAVVGKPVFGKVDGQFFSRVKGRQFAFEDIEYIEVAHNPPTRNGKWALSVLAKEVNSDLKLL